MLPALACSYLTETDATLFTTLPNKTTTAHTIMINKLPPKKWQKQVTEKTFQEMYINVGMANCEKRPKQERDDIRFTHTGHPYIFLPHQLTAPPNTHCMPITYPFIIIHARITQQLHHMHKYNNSKSLFSHNCIMAPSSQSNNQKALKLQSSASAKQPTATSELDLSLPHTSRPPHATACSFHTYFHIITTCLICYMMH